LELIDRALANGIQVAAWTFDEGYGRDGAFLNGLEERKQVFVGEVPANFHGWVRKPRVLRSGPSGGRGRKKKYPRRARRPIASEVQDLARYSPSFFDKKWQRYRIKDTHRGPEVWEVKWAVFWRKGPDDLPGRRHTLIVARNVLTKEVKYFVANRVPGEQGVSLRWLMSVAFQRWSIESCFRQAKEELGLDHYEVRGWRCVLRHFYLTQLSHLFCARMRQKFAAELPLEDGLEELTTEQVRSAINVWLTAFDNARTRLERESKKQKYYQRRNRQARKSHTKTRTKRLLSLGIDPDGIKSCVPRPAA
jgi:SRSO17 transposase